MDFIKREAKRSRRKTKLSAFPPDRPEKGINVTMVAIERTTVNDDYA